MRRLFLVLPVLLAGCTSLRTLVDVALGDARQPATRQPLYVYRADLQINIESVSFDGVGVTIIGDHTDIDVQSQIHLDRVEVETCARQEVCQNGKNCSDSFAIDDGWWGQAGKHMTYRYTPSAVERTGECPVYIRVFDKKDLAAWGYLAMRNQEDLPAKMTCNGRPTSFRGHSVCQTKQGKIQRISFDSPVDDFDADKECGMTKVDAKTFELRPVLGFCTADFVSGNHRHGLDVVGYDEVLVRGSE